MGTGSEDGGHAELHLEVEEVVPGVFKEQALFHKVCLSARDKVQPLSFPTNRSIDDSSERWIDELIIAGWIILFSFNFKHFSNAL